MAKQAQKTAPKKTGRPTKYDPIVAKKILYAVAEGQSLREVCKAPGMPKDQTFRAWVSRDIDGLLAQYTQARKLQAFWHVDKIHEVAFDPKLDAQQKRVIIDALKWTASKLLPRQFGPRLLDEDDEHDEVSSTDDVPTIPQDEQDRTAGPIVIMAVEPEENYLPQSAPAAADVPTIDLEPNRKVAK